MTILEIDGRTYHTPLTAVRRSTVGTARLVKKHYRGTYHFEGVQGYEYYRTRDWLPVIGLQQRNRAWRTWMVDDPLHWYGMGEAVSDLPDGRVLVAGLGLGLMLHHMATQPRFTAITVIEQNPDVVALMQPTLPRDTRVEILVGDYYEFLTMRPAVDGVLWDLAVGSPDQTYLDMIRGLALTQYYLPSIPLVQFGIRRRNNLTRV